MEQHFAVHGQTHSLQARRVVIEGLRGGASVANLKSASIVAADAPGKQCITAGCRGQTRDEENKWCDPCFENMKCILDKKWPVADWPAACIVLEWKADTDCQASPEGLHPC